MNKSFRTSRPAVLPWAACVLAGALGGAAFAATSGPAPAVPMPGSIDCNKPGQQKEPVCNQKADPGIERVPSANADPGIAKAPPPTADGLGAAPPKVDPQVGRNDNGTMEAGGAKKPIPKKPGG